MLAGLWRETERMRKLQLPSLAGQRNNVDMVEMGMGLTGKETQRTHDCAELYSHHAHNESKNRRANQENLG